MFKKLFFHVIKCISLRLTPVTDLELQNLGFDNTKLYYRLTDLNIYFARGNFFYLTKKGNRKILKNMLQVSNLIYGKTDYLHV
jgi:hypothetical protein